MLKARTAAGDDGGGAIVLRVFGIGRANIAGCRVLNGVIERSSRVHLIREQKILNDYSIGSLRRGKKDDSRESAGKGMECGIRLDGFNDIKEGDLLEALQDRRKSAARWNS